MFRMRRQSNRFFEREMTFPQLSGTNAQAKNKYTATSTANSKIKSTIKSIFWIRSWNHQLAAWTLKKTRLILNFQVEYDQKYCKIAKSCGVLLNSVRTAVRIHAVSELIKVQVMHVCFNLCCAMLIFLHWCGIDAKIMTEGENHISPKHALIALTAEYLGLKE